MAVLWLIHGGDPNYLLTGMILQAGGCTKPGFGLGSFDHLLWHSPSRRAGKSLRFADGRTRWRLMLVVSIVEPVVEPTLPSFLSGNNPIFLLKV